MDTLTHRTLEDRANGICRMIRALGRNPVEWDPASLHYLDLIDGELLLVRAAVIYALRDNGHTDSDIGRALGVTQQAVSKRWPGGRRYVGGAGRYRKPTLVEDDVHGGR